MAFSPSCAAQHRTALRDHDLGSWRRLAGFLVAREGLAFSRAARWNWRGGAARARQWQQNRKRLLAICASGRFKIVQRANRSKTGAVMT
jgi:hypothetical protein